MANLLDISTGGLLGAGQGATGVNLLPAQTALTGTIGLGGSPTVTIGGQGATGDTGTTASAGPGLGVNAYLGDLGGASLNGASGADPALQINLLHGLGDATGLGAGAGATTGAGGAGVGVGTAALPDPTTAYVNIFRLSGASEIPASTQTQLDALQTMVNEGQITAKQAVLQVADAAAGFTSVAETSYAFFSGLTPTADGLTYLTHSPANGGDLSDSYYAPFNLENRYINFASNLGLHSDYAPQFAQDFGTLTLNDTIATAYERIVGASAAQAAGIDPQAAIRDIQSRDSYFVQVAHDRFGDANQDLSAKLAAIGYIMEEAVKADVGNYGQANQNFLFDLADGHAQFHIDLVGTYGPGTAYDV